MLPFDVLRTPNIYKFKTDASTRRNPPENISIVKNIEAQGIMVRLEHPYPCQFHFNLSFKLIYKLFQKLKTGNEWKRQRVSVYKCAVCCAPPSPSRSGPVFDFQHLCYVHIWKKWNAKGLEQVRIVYRLISFLSIAICGRRRISNKIGVRCSMFCSCTWNQCLADQNDSGHHSKSATSMNE